MLAVVPVILGKHFPELLRQGVGFLPGVRGRLTGLVVPDSESGAAAITEFKSFDRIQRVLGNFLIEYRHWTVYVIRHVILRWVPGAGSTWGPLKRGFPSFVGGRLAQRVVGQSRDRVRPSTTILALKEWLGAVEFV